MPLFLPTLIGSMMTVDEPPPKTAEAVAEAWFNAWWAYASQMAYWNPVVLPLTEVAVRPVFLAALLPGCVPNPVPGIFYLALEVASIAGWVTGSAIPLALLPAYQPIPLIPPPLPGALSAALIATAPIGLATPTKAPVRVAMATAIDIWTHLFTITPIAGPPPVPIL